MDTTPTIMFFEAEVRSVMTVERAREVRALRCDDNHTWRALAAVLHDRWDDADWDHGNQLAGMALCEVAGELLEEDGINW